MKEIMIISKECQGGIKKKKLLKLAIEDTYYMFINNCYKQTDGLAMGSPLSATLANIFLCHHERKWINECPVDFKPTYNITYVDDTFAIFENQDQANKFLDYMNKQLQKIKFTIETEHDKIPFLDLLVRKTSGNIQKTNAFWSWR